MNRLAAALRLSVDIFQRPQQRMPGVRFAQLDQASLRIVANSRQRLIELVCEAGGHFPSTFSCGVLQCLLLSPQLLSGMEQLSPAPAYQQRDPDMVDDQQRQHRQRQADGRLMLDQPALDIQPQPPLFRVLIDGAQQRFLAGRGRCAHRKGDCGGAVSKALPPHPPVSYPGRAGRRTTSWGKVACW